MRATLFHRTRRILIQMNNRSWLDDGLGLRYDHRSNAEHYGVTEANWMDAVQGGKQHAEHFSESETPYFVGRAIASLAADPEASNRSGQALSSWGLSDVYGFTDVDGRRPH